MVWLCIVVDPLLLVASSSQVLVPILFCLKKLSKFFGFFQMEAPI